MTLTNRSPSSGYPSASATARAMDGMSVLDMNPGYDEPENRPMPSDDDLTGIISSLFGALFTPFDGTALEDEVQDIAWSFVDLFHRKAERMQTRLDDVENRIKAVQADFDGSEIASVELERIVNQGDAMMARREAIEHLRDTAAEEFENLTGTAWRPRSRSSMVNHKRMTASMIQGSAFISAKRRLEAEVLIPKGTRIAFTGSRDCEDPKPVWDMLDRVLAKHPDMVLVHTGNRVGADAAAAAWARTRKVVDVPFPPKSKGPNDSGAPFRRNDELLSTMPIGLVYFGGTGINANLADKAKALGIKVMRAA